MLGKTMQWKDLREIVVETRFAVSVTILRLTDLSFQVLVYLMARILP